MRLHERRAPVEQVQTIAERLGDSIRDFPAKVLQRSVDDPAKPARGQLVARRRLVDRYDAADFQGVELRLAFVPVRTFHIAVLDDLELGLGDLQALALPLSLDLAVKRHQRAWLESVF